VALYEEVVEPRTYKRSRVVELEEVDISHIQHLRPLGRTTTVPLENYVHYELPLAIIPSTPPLPRNLGPSKQDIADVIAEASKRAEEEALRRVKEVEAAAAAKAAEEKKAARKASSSANRDKGKKKALSADEVEKLKEKKLLKLVGAVVVKCLSKHRDRMDHDTFKKHAKEVSGTGRLLKRKGILTDGIGGFVTVDNDHLR
jgi:histone-lysine N-methyltransferase SETD2